MSITYGTFNGQKLTKFKNAQSLRSLAIIYLKVILRNENLKLNDKDLLTYLEGWCDWSQDTEEPQTDPEMMIDVAADTIVFSNIHFMNCNTRTDISNEDRDVVLEVITEYLNRPFA